MFDCDLHIHNCHVIDSLRDECSSSPNHTSQLIMIIGKTIRGAGAYWTTLARSTIGLFDFCSWLVSTHANGTVMFVEYDKYQGICFTAHGESTQTTIGCWGWNIGCSGCVLWIIETKWTEHVPSFGFSFQKNAFMWLIHKNDAVLLSMTIRKTKKPKGSNRWQSFRQFCYQNMHGSYISASNYHDSSSE